MFKLYGENIFGIEERKISYAVETAIDIIKSRGVLKPNVIGGDFCKSVSGFTMSGDWLCINISR
jgi:hypothetical protein